MRIIAFLVVGALAGWIASLIVKKRGLGLFMDLLVGIAGALIGGFIFRISGLQPVGGFFTSLLTAILGSVVLLSIIKLIKKTA